MNKYNINYFIEDGTTVTISVEAEAMYDAYVISRKEMQALEANGINITGYEICPINV